MKKAIAMIVTAAMMFSMTACAGNKGNENPTNTPTVAPTESADNQTPAPTEAPAPEAPVVIAPEVKENTVGSILWEAFVAAKTENPEATTEEIANMVVSNPIIEFAGGAAPVEEGWLAGFSADITGFQSAAQFGPMMGSIAFVGYVFDLAADADVNAFMTTLKDNANLRWNVCVEADYLQIGAYGNSVYLLMYPEYMNESLGGGAEATIPAEADIIVPEVEAGTQGETLWNSFVEGMDAAPESAAVDMAFWLAMDPSLTFSASAAEVEAGFLQGFTEEISGFQSAAIFCPMVSSQAFVGYVFELEVDADREAFIANLKNTCDPRWNVCVEAEQTVVGAYNNLVFFLMCPKAN